MSRIPDIDHADDASDRPGGRPPGRSHSVQTSVTRLRDRIHSDFLMPSRLDAYRELLESSQAAGYLDDTWRVEATSGFEPLM